LAEKEDAMEKTTNNPARRPLAFFGSALAFGSAAAMALFIAPSTASAHGATRIHTHAPTNTTVVRFGNPTLTRAEIAERRRLRRKAWRQNQRRVRRARAGAWRRPQRNAYRYRRGIYYRGYVAPRHYRNGTYRNGRHDRDGYRAHLRHQLRREAIRKHNRRLGREAVRNHDRRVHRKVRRELRRRELRREVRKQVRREKRRRLYSL
jgi:hypothetical protein